MKRILLIILSLIPLFLLAQTGSVTIISSKGSYIDGKAGNTFTLQIEVGNPASVTNLVGISFHLNWDNSSAITLLKTSAGSFLGDDAMVISQDYLAYTEVGLASSTGGHSGSGTIAECEFIVVQDVARLIPVVFTVTNLSAIDNDGKSINLSTTNSPFTLNLCKDIPLSLTLCNGNEFLKTGIAKIITWQADIAGNVKLEYSTDNGSSWMTIIESILATNKTFTWTIPNTPSEECLVKITSLTDSQLFDISETTFTIYPEFTSGFGPYYPDENTVLLMHFNNDLKNSSTLSSGGSLIGDGSTYNASTPLESGSSFRFDGNDYISVSDCDALGLTGDWTIEAWVRFDKLNLNEMMDSYIVNKPGDSDAYHANYAIQSAYWYGSVFYGYYFSQNKNRYSASCPKPDLNKWYHIAFLRDTQKMQQKLLVHDENLNLISSDVQPYTDQNVLTNGQPLKIGEFLNGSIDELRISNMVRDFRRLSIITPNGSEEFVGGSKINITWSSSLIDKLKLELSVDNGQTWATIASNIDASNGSYTWTVPPSYSTTCKIRISDHGDASFFDISDQLFSIIKTVTPELVDVTFSVDLNYQISNGIFNQATDKVFVKGTFNGWSEQNQMAEDGNTGVYICTIALNAESSYEYKYYITSAGAENGGWEMNISSGENGNRLIQTGTVSSVLDKDYFNNFRVSGQLSLIAPNGGESWKVGSTQSITWNSDGVNNVKLEYTTDLGATWTTITNSTSASAHSYSFTVPHEIAYEWKIRISDISDATNSDISEGLIVTYDVLPQSVAPLMSIEYPVFCWPLNAYYPVASPIDNQMINGRVGNACGPTVVANALRFWEFPRKGTGSRTFTDALGCTWSADFENTEYQYDRMSEIVPFEASQQEYDAVATLMYHSGVAMHNYFRSGDRSGVIDAMRNYFNFSKKAKFLSREDYTPEQWEKIVKSELSQGRPLITEGWGSIQPNGDHDGHWFFCDGYNAENLYHIRWDYGESANEYCSLYKFGGYSDYNWMFVYLEPELNGKKIELTSPSGGENWQPGTEQTITWNSSGVSSVKIEYSSNNGYDYSILASGVQAANGSYRFIVPDVLSDKCKIRITDESNINIYSRNKIPFSDYDSIDITVSFSVDLNYQISNGIFNRVTDKVFVKGTFNDWSEQNQMTEDGNTGVYTCTITLDRASSYEYKYYITSAGAENSGWESNVGSGSNGNRAFETTNVSIVLPTDYYNNLKTSIANLTSHFSLNAYPNPFDSYTQMKFSLTERSVVSLSVFDLYGREVDTIVSGDLSAGEYSFRWEPGLLPAGVYLCRLLVGKSVETKKLILLTGAK